MKRVSLWKVFILAVLAVSLSALSCSKEKTENKGMPPGHEKMVEEYQKSIKESRKTVVARVNGADITMYDLSGRMRQILPQYIQGGRQMTPEIEQRARQDALDALIFRELAVQEALRRKMKAPQEKVDAALQQLKAKMGSEKEYRAYLKREDLTEAWLRNQIEKDQLFNMIVGAEILAKIKVDEKQIRDIYAKEKKEFVMPEVFEVVDVVFPKGRDDEAAMKKAKEVLPLVRKNSNDVSKLPKDKTFMVREGFVEKQEYPALFAALTKMKQGEVSDVIREEDGLHIVRMKKKEPARPMTFEEAGSVIGRQMQASLAEQRKEEWEKELKKNAKIEIVPAGVAQQLSGETSKGR
ncbi:MAG: peptidyl-prolyl cis-trans isomerase [Nitrospirae bacterium]|nr:peptidyl-prolyl cis-trans isomerase [Nitrospirota bacterium]